MALIGEPTKQFWHAAEPRRRRAVRCLVRDFEPIVGGIDLNKARMRAIVEAVIALSSSPSGFTASNVAARVRAIGYKHHAQYGPRQAAYDLKSCAASTSSPASAAPRPYEGLPSGLRR
jgi:hypothetical protein